MSIERIDNDKGYCPENCKFIPLKDQVKNRRRAKCYEPLRDQPNISILAKHPPQPDEWWRQPTDNR